MSLVYRKYYFLFLFFVVFAQNTAAQNMLSTSNILATAKTHTTVALQEQKIEATKTASFRLPLVEKIDFQTETDRFQFQRQEYRVRTSFNGWEEMKSLKKQKENKLTKERADRTVLFKDILLDRYNLLVEYRFAQKERQMNQELHDVFAEKRDVLQKMARLSTNFNIEDLIKAEDAIFDLQQKIIESEGTIRHIQSFLKRTYNSTDSFQLDTAGWLPLSNLRRLIAELPVSVDKNPILVQQEAIISTVQSDYNLEKARSKKIIDNAQVRNSARNRDVLIREWSVGLGVTIPYRGSSKPQLDMLSLKRLDEENKFKNLQTDLDLQVFNIQQGINLIFKEYDYVEKQVNESQTLYALDHYAAIQGSPPIILLRMKELVLKRQVQLISLEHNAFQKYIKLLDMTGQLVEMPLKNYLSAGLQAF